MQSQRGLKKDTELTKFVLGAHPIIEHFMEIMRIGETLSSYLPSDKRRKLDDDKVITLLIHNILTTPYALYRKSSRRRLRTPTTSGQCEPYSARGKASIGSVRMSPVIWIGGP